MYTVLFMRLTSLEGREVAGSLMVIEGTDYKEFVQAMCPPTLLTMMLKAKIIDKKYFCQNMEKSRFLHPSLEMFKTLKVNKSPASTFQ